MGLVVFVGVLLAPVAAQPEMVRVEVVADTNLSQYPSERGLNYGQSSALRVKGIEMFALMDFDPGPLGEVAVERAALRFRAARDDHKLRTLGFYTVAAPWVEGTGRAEEGMGATWLSPDGSGALWGPGPDFLAVSFTHGHTRVAYAEVRELGDRWLEADVDPDLIHAVMAGASHGLLIADETGQTRANNDIHSREQSGSEPYLLVTLGAEPREGPLPAPGDLAVAPLPEKATPQNGAAAVSWSPVEGAFAYRCWIGDTEAPRWLVPWPEPGAEPRVILTGLEPEASVRVTVAAVDRLGRMGPSAHGEGQASEARPTGLALPAPSPEAPPPALVQAARFGVSTGSLLAKVDPTRAPELPAEGIRLQATRNEFVAATLVIDAPGGTLAEVEVTATPPRCEAGALPAPALYRLWYLNDGGWAPEVCVPLQGPLEIPAADNGVPGQRNQSLLVEFYVPHAAAPGRYQGEVAVSAEGEAIRAPVEVIVGSPSLPDDLGFVLELNSYGDVAGQYGVASGSPEYVAIEREYHRAAHRHRANWDPLPYSQAWAVIAGGAPPLEGEGPDRRVADWSAWDARYGPLLDGSAFADLPRAGVPVHSLYLPFNENWPSSMALYRAHVDEPAYPDMLTEHALTAPPIAEAFEPPYAQEFAAVVASFAAHVAERGWNRSWLHFYMNNKYDFRNPEQGGRGSSWWLLDEPMHRDDWLALRFYADLCHAGAPQAGPPLISRGDISRPQWQPRWMDGAFDLICTARELFEHHALCMGIAERAEEAGQPVTFWHYGTANAVGRPNAEAVAWPWAAFLAGADGILPWNTIGSDGNFTEPADTAILYPGRRFGIEGPVVSLRLKAMLRGAQDVELLRLLAERTGVDRRELRSVFGPLVTGTTAQAYAEDAGRIEFGPLTEQALDDARRAVRAALEAAS